MSWQNGDFDRHSLPAHIKFFAPAHAAKSLPDIDLEALWNRGKRLLLMDMDHTLVMWREEEFSEPVLEWVRRAKALGFQLCILSNTKNPARLERLGKKLEIETVRGRMKPSRSMFRQALIKFRVPREAAVMIGDQMMTDILGANRAGIDAIWVQRMEGKEFTGTKINRFLEGLLTGPVYKAIVTPVDQSSASVEEEQKLPLLQRSVSQQLIKFLIVGGSSFVIDYSIRMTLLFGIAWQGESLGIRIGETVKAIAPGALANVSAQDAAFPVGAGIAASAAILNSFVWNRLWTFQIRGKVERAAQLRRFLAVAVSGLLLNVVIGSLLNHAIPGDPKVGARIATIAAALIVAVWNFVGQRYFAFRNAK